MSQKRHNTNHPGVFFIKGKSLKNGKPEKIFYMRYRIDGRLIEEKAGRESHGMTAPKAASLRFKKIEGTKPTNAEHRAARQAKAEAEKNRWTIDKLWAEYTSQRDETKGLKVDHNRYRNHLQKPFGSKTPDEIHTLDADRLRMKMLKSKSPQTVKHVLALLKRAINFGVKKGLCPRPDLHIQLPKVDNKKTEDLTPKELKRLLQAIEADENRQVANLMKLALYTGMRRGELFKLKWKHINFERGFLRIVAPKGGKTQEIPLNDAARTVLENHERTGSEFVFPGRNGQQRKYIHHQTKRIKERAELPKDFRALHGLRHVYATMLASSGKMDMYTLQKLLTHKSPAMTQRYAHLRDEALQRASNVADEIFRDVQNEEPAKVINFKTSYK